MSVRRPDRRHSKTQSAVEALPLPSRDATSRLPFFSSDQLWIAGTAVVIPASGVFPAHSKVWSK